jgi:hypothetical protein
MSEVESIDSTLNAKEADSKSTSVIRIPGRKYTTEHQGDQGYCRSSQERSHSDAAMDMPWILHLKYWSQCRMSDSAGC